MFIVAGNWTRERPSAGEEGLRYLGGGASAGGVLLETCKKPMVGLSGAGPPMVKSVRSLYGGGDSDIAKMVTKSNVLYARFQKRAAELAGEQPGPKKKARISAAVVAEKSAPRAERSEAGRGEGSSSGGTSSAEATMALPCPAPISQHLHEIETLMHIVQDYRDRARRHQRGQEEAEARCLASEAEQKVLQTKVEAAEDKIRALTTELEEEKGAHALAKSEVRAVEARRAEATLMLAIREQEVKEVHLKAQELEARLSEAQSLLAVREQEVRDLERKAKQREAREKVAREQAQNAGVNTSKDPARAEVQAAEEATWEAPAEGDPEGVPYATPEAAGEIPAEASATAAGQAGEPRDAPAENFEAVVADDLGAGAEAAITS
ncbi:colicin-A-like [Phoenix dactylifera]|uniref:Colicin-A-like n=1 Tax=Phoenix dactylifera TaxID=42345 RepID=A0A8B8ZP00_PHODC|nr:colicin-A-like [Phoenix dactylifera]